MWIHGSAERSARVVDLINQVTPSGSDAADQIRMSAKVFRARMQNQINTEFRRPLIDRCCEGAINESNDLTLFRNCHGFAQVNYAQGWIGWRL